MGQRQLPPPDEKRETPAIRRRKIYHINDPEAIKLRCSDEPHQSGYTVFGKWAVDDTPLD
ncbi:hypothetical protein PABG_11296 [Paracoccidioides brasiliensis Pb03]|uniref:Uncharacterized protein n=1 Tax=Paracoccidioides brasiliensis (strain Pb18) TaxID=502780 RepID=A0A0A0HSN1_PARBD|nr:uncharacterized protein PADG_11737 [Paracoccidioides brasiliensis Pb18]KGM92199.1 hypothetical protein PADG_11737 [Paracoccidioides brasiliensis Pb18]KGY15643.1 hypothetical protein PABG_11296 [Paracoccidioides brasiliensis Pb03]ODH50504.1 hypothetical protein GX48_03322 [Paracoccidioides brasiliensis]